MIAGAADQYRMTAWLWYFKPSFFSKSTILIECFRLDIPLVSPLSAFIRGRVTFATSGKLVCELAHLLKVTPAEGVV